MFALCKTFLLSGVGKSETFWYVHSQKEKLKSTNLIINIDEIEGGATSDRAR